MIRLFNRTISILETMLNYRAKKHEIIVSNIANLDVPDWISSDLRLKKNDGVGTPTRLDVRVTHPRHIASEKSTYDPLIDYEVITLENVTLDTHMANLAENQLIYNATIEMLARKFRQLNNVLKEVK
ncbi:MAG: flagellar basal body rod protein FlgB [Syntrophales bacterium]|nr:flagellar basal body rod protein FlgB [Syntrophales bacterium]